MSEFNIQEREAGQKDNLAINDLLLILTFYSQNKLEFKRKQHLDFLLHYGYFSWLIPTDCFLLDYIQYLMVFCVILVLSVSYFFQVDIFTVFLLSIYKLYIASLYRNQTYLVLHDIFLDKNRMKCEEIKSRNYFGIISGFLLIHWLAV